jgi:hypothetical protein
LRVLSAVIHKTHVGHYTFNSKSIVRDPKRMIVAHNIFSNSYEGGENVKFFSGETQQPGENAEVLQEKMIGSRTASKGDASIFCMMCPLQLEGFSHLLAPNPIALGGSLPSALYREREACKLPGTSFYNALFPELRQLADQPSDGAPAFEAVGDEYTYANFVLWQGTQRVGETEIMGTGHWGGNTYPGCKAVRNGQYAAFRGQGASIRVEK